MPTIIEGCFQGYRSGHAELRCVTEWFFSNYPQKLENVGLSVINGKGASRIGEGNMRSFFQIEKQVFRWNIEYSEEWKIKSENEIICIIGYFLVRFIFMDFILFYYLYKSPISHT